MRIDIYIYICVYFMLYSHIYVHQIISIAKCGNVNVRTINSIGEIFRYTSRARGVVTPKKTYKIQRLPRIRTHTHTQIIFHNPVMLLEGKKVAITGGSAGIGRAIAIEMAKNGADIAINYYPDDKQNELAESLRKEIEGLSRKFISVPGDIGDPEVGRKLTRETVRAFGELNVFVSNAGICPFHDFTTMPEEIYYRTVQTNLNGAFFATQAAAAQMKEQGKGGSIIGVSSISAMVGGEFQTHYTPTKAGIVSMMNSISIGLGKHGIRCNSLLPGTIETDINKEDLSDLEKRHKMEQRIPLGRLGEPDDLAGPAVFLASDLSKYVTGAQILTDGGLYVNLQ